jgi:hypothetical protein
MASLRADRFRVRCKVHQLNITKSRAEEPIMATLVDSLCASINKQMDRIIAYSST